MRLRVRRRLMEHPRIPNATPDHQQRADCNIDNGHVSGLGWLAHNWRHTKSPFDQAPTGLWRNGERKFHTFHGTFGQRKAAKRRLVTMARFRPPGPSEPLTLETVLQLAVQVLQPEHFYVGAELALEWDYAKTEETSWEVFQGRLLDQAHTRERRVFETWNVYQMEAGGRSAEALLSLKWDAAARRFYIVRGIDSYVWAG